ncbi:MAG: hypothetical protein VR64_25005 [Desulfatitalea sp. BRH_c12]|nr:MAG: hypothetical protein VR64_25005 [Desulfatitalea sp. BRH_c12]
MQKEVPIAIVSMAGVFPRATGIEQFWRNIVDKVDATEVVPTHRWCGPLDWVYDRAPAPDKAYSKRACLIDGFRFDGSDMAIDPAEVAGLDPLYQWVLYATGDALRHCDVSKVDKKRVGAILAAIALPTRSSSALASKLFGAQLLGSLLPAQNAPAISAIESLRDRVVARPASLVCSAFGLGGTAYTLDAACASSLYALKLACDELRGGRADAMITGGVSAADCLYTQIGFSQLRALSPSGRCAPFDRTADGLVVGEGAGILVLKRLDDALRDQDTIYGVIRGIGLSNDMRGNLLAPESDGQLRAMRAAYSEAGWQPWDVDYIECHGAGTLVGDATELKSLRTLWQAADSAHRCAIGSVKSMIGHLLTAAGAAGLIKTLLGLQRHILPPSLKFERPAEGSPLIDSPFAVQTTAAPWLPKDASAPRRAAVSAFGFGGINGHVLIEEWPRPSDGSACQKVPTVAVTHTRATERRSDAIAIVGMDLCLGSLQSVQAFQQAVFAGHSALRAVPAERWKAPGTMRELFGTAAAIGGFMQEIVVAIGEFQIPPGEIADILPQQLLMLKTAAGAIHDAGLPLREPRARMGAIIGIGFDYEATNFHLRWVLPQLLEEWRRHYGWTVAAEKLEQWLERAKDACGPPLTPSRTLGALGGIVASRIAREFRLGGPSFVVSEEEASGLRAVEIAMRMLRSRQTDAMLVGAVDLAGDERNLATLLARGDVSPSGMVRPFDHNADGTLPGEGAVALVLKRLEDAQADGDRIYAVIRGVGSARGNDAPALPAAYRESLAHALDDARISADTVTLVETHGSAIVSEDAVEAEALTSFMRNAGGRAPEHAVSISALKPLVGHTGATSGLASLAKTSLCLFHHLLPAMPHFDTAGQRQLQEGPFHFPRQTTYWAGNREEGARTAVVAAMTGDGNCMHAVLAQSDAAGSTPTGPVLNQRRRPMGPLPYALFVVKGDSKEDLMAGLRRVEQLASTCDHASAPMEQLGRHWFKNEQPTTGRSQTLSILAHSPEELRGYLAQAQRVVQDAQTHPMAARGGVCYLPAIAQQKGRLAFVFPGSGNHYVGMGRTLGAHWPEILRDMDGSTARLKAQMLPHLYDPWRSNWCPGWPTESYQALVADPLHPIFGQVVFGSQMGGLLRGFQLQPDAVIGYSLGESAGLFALGAWIDHGQMLARLAASDLFKTELCGPLLSLKRAWGLAADQEVHWVAAVVNRPAEQVDRAIAHAQHVRRLIINTPNECVIGGIADAVAKVIAALGCEALYLDGVVTVHCDAAQPVAQAYKDLHRFATHAVPGVQFYSCARGESYALTSESAADSILRQALHGFDFPRTIGQAYTDGVRVFVEVGPQSSCTRMIRQILGDRPHLAVAANVRGEDECLTLLKCLGTVAAAGMDVDMALLYDYAQGPGSRRGSAPAEANRKTIRVKVGGRPLQLPPLPIEKNDPQLSTTGPAPVSPQPADMADIAPMPAAPPPSNAAPSAVSEFQSLLATFDANVAATAQVHEQFLDLSQEMTRRFAETFQLQNHLIGVIADLGGGTISAPSEPVAFTREQCMEFAVGSVGKVLGPAFDVIDTYKCRVRLPDEPLMLVDRIMLVEGEKGALGPGRLVTEHDVLPGAWYLDGGRAPVCISVEAGQADLFLSSYLGIDHQVKGERAYRLLDAKIQFHRGLPRAGETIRYDIHIDKFVKQGATYLFFFRFEGHIDGQHLITMTEGCAGFFTEQEVANSGGIILTDEDRAPATAIGGKPFFPILPLPDRETFHDAQIEALRSGDAAACFGPDFAGVTLPDSLCLPQGRMRLIDRIVACDPAGGRWGKGLIKAEADIQPDAWFLTCHFVDDKVMPGTLMYECCAHTLRVLLSRLGWVTDSSAVAYEPVPEVPCRLKCRGPVTPQTRHVHYVVEIKEMGYRPEPYVLADAHMYADGDYIVFFKDMSLQMTGLSQAGIEDFWRRRGQSNRLSTPAQPPVLAAIGPKPPLFTRAHILEFAQGRPSKAFGEPYAPFDDQRRIARLPAPPYCFMDRVTAIEPEPWVVKADGWIEAQYDMRADDWYFTADRSGVMPFCILLEIALQPCGWLAAYVGSALRSRQDLKFRNLGGRATLYENLLPADRTLTMRARISKVSEAADMIIENFDFEVHDGDKPVYSGTTYFGFFTAQALAQQVGLREAVYRPDEDTHQADIVARLADEAPLVPDDVQPGTIGQPQGLVMPAKALRMIDSIDLFQATGGPQGLGYVRGRKQVDPSEWFFKAHFYQDPVCPGSLGVESFLQLIKYAAMQRWPELRESHRFEMASGQAHEWQYRGQVVPTNRTVTVEAVITRVAEGLQPLMVADGWLQVDGLYIYKMVGFGLRLVAI